MNRLKTSLNKKTSVVIPVFNEEGFVGKVVSGVLPHVDGVIVVDDGCSDNSLSEIPSDSKIHIIRHYKNKGKGSALRSGFEFVLSEGFEYIVTLDADLQHPPSLIPQFINALDTKDVIIGARRRDLNVMPIHRIASNYLTSKILSYKLHIPILDSQCGFRAFRCDILRSIMPKRTGFEAETEMLIYAGQSGLRIGFIEIPTIYGREKSKMRSMKTIFEFIKLVIQ